MRELKFRAWDGQKMHKAFDLSQNPLYWWKDNYDYPLMQYTGQKDTNGVEIYEGDFIKAIKHPNGPPYEIKWSTQYNAFCPTWHGESIGWDGKNYEVMGNIYENKELLNENS